jgi:hypothetical protein
MAKVGKNVLTRGLSGKVGNLVVFRHNGDGTIMSAAPGKRTRPLTESQQLHLQQFKEAVIYAKSVMADPGRKAVYEPLVSRGISVYNLAVADFMKPPVIREMDISNYTGQTGDKIRVRAMDNFKISEIGVTIFKADNTIVESGVAAAESNGLDWFYTAAHENTSMSGGRVVATVTDTPGHSVMMTQML